ncbi:hypothetical protein KW791_02580, partial [Candidatus Parcubacteria bacterium]|nr:hypothetical protein [Candidatus Parcubacteria bacterium]
GKDDVNEAIITELEIRFDQEFFRELPELKEEIEEKDLVIRNFINKDGPNPKMAREVAGVLQKEKTSDGTRYSWIAYPYAGYRAKFNQLAEDLYEKNKTEFQSPEEVFTLFAKAALSGRLLPVARLIEKTYGKGKFRELGEKTVMKYERTD